MPKTISRRSFLVGCAGAIAALAGSRLTSLAFYDPSAEPAIPVPNAINSAERLIVVFLRGGWDALNVVPPIAGEDRGHYESARPRLKIPVSGAGAAINLNGQFGLHPAMAPLFPFYQAKKLALIHAVGLQYDTRSHFDAMQYIELGTPGLKTAGTGWITRHLQTASNLPGTLLFPALSAGGSQASSLLGYNDAVAMNNPNSFRLNGHWQYEDEQRAALRDLYTGDIWLQTAGTEALNMIDTIESTNPGNYIPANGAVYPNGSFGDNLKTIAQLIKMQIGLHVATVDLGGWDTHEQQGDGSTGYFATNLLTPLAQGLAAFYKDLDGGCGSNFIKRTTVIVMSEFGRRLKENANRGTDHGHGSVMLALGGTVKGGAVYGQWPGLNNANLYDGADLAITTDYRRILSEILTRRLGNFNLSAIFPGYTNYAPLDFLLNAYPDPTPIPPGLDKKTFLPAINAPGASDNLCP
ncbi:MAG: DUF1501 domain-containing protein [Anaerolineae bacterium]|nr:DUF1501 domain-containing protein [Anaerolineae bacterium]